MRRLLSVNRMAEIRRILEVGPGVKALPICEVESIVEDLFSWISLKERQVDELTSELNVLEDELYSMEQYCDSSNIAPAYDKIIQGLEDLHWSQVVGNHLQCAYCHERWPCATIQVTQE